MNYLRELFGNGDGTLFPKLAVGILVIYILVSLCAKDDLLHFLGPRVVAWTRLYFVAAIITGREHEIMLEMHRKYGETMRNKTTLLYRAPDC